jgi:hypothetical protein
MNHIKVVDHNLTQWLSGAGRQREQLTSLAINAIKHNIPRAVWLQFCADTYDQAQAETSRAEVAG